jgi:hypothetical protein
MIVGLLAACGATSTPTPTVDPTPREPDAAPVVEAEPPPEPTGPLPLYSTEEALADALSGPLTHVGTGKWPGIHRSSTCVYRNARVLVVNVYCTTREMKAFRVDIYSPERGRLRIYAEGRAPVSTLTRRDYFTFKAEGEPAPAPEAGLPPVTLGMSFAEIRAYDEKRYQKFLPSCYGGVEIGKAQGGCLGELEPRLAEWSRKNDTFLAQPPPDWYRLVKELRARAPRDGKNADRPGD